MSGAKSHRKIEKFHFKILQKQYFTDQNSNIVSSMCKIQHSLLYKNACRPLFPQKKTKNKTVQKLSHNCRVHYMQYTHTHVVIRKKFRVGVAQKGARQKMRKDGWVDVLKKDLKRLGGGGKNRIRSSGRAVRWDAVSSTLEYWYSNVTDWSGRGTSPVARRRRRNVRQLTHSHRFG